MRRFRFKFQTLETVRKTRENETLRSLSEAQTNFLRANQHKDALVADLNAALIRREMLGQVPVTVLDFIIEADFITGTKQRIVQADQAILRAKRGVEKALRVYLHARRQTRAMEVLREKAYRDFRIELARKEQKDLDDLYVMRNRMKRVNSEADL